MKKLLMKLLTIVNTAVVTAIIVYFTMIYNLKIVNVNDNTVEIQDVTNNVNVYDFEK